MNYIFLDPEKNKQMDPIEKEIIQIFNKHKRSRIIFRQNYLKKLYNRRLLKNKFFKIQKVKQKTKNSFKPQMKPETSSSNESLNKEVNTQICNIKYRSILQIFLFELQEMMKSNSNFFRDFLENEIDLIF